MTINPKSIIPSTDVLIACRAGLTKRINDHRKKLVRTSFDDIRKQYKDELYKLKVIRDEIQWLIDNI